MTTKDYGTNLDIGSELTGGFVLLGSRISDRGEIVVMGFNPANPHPFVTWRLDMVALQDGNVFCYSGDYCLTIEDAYDSMLQRAFRPR